ncbi:hypothetical protein B0H13DRAFT_2431805 [Mycena leptocephala]|nr:hypothetical protein B0H13DRAFT_2431805 [Mycena leptocephala]
MFFIRVSLQKTDNMEPVAAFELHAGFKRGTPLLRQLLPGHVRRIGQYEDPVHLGQGFPELESTQIHITLCRVLDSGPRRGYNRFEPAKKIVGLSHTHSRQRRCYSLAKTQCVSYRTSQVNGAIIEDFYFVFPTQAPEYRNVIERTELAVEI